MKATTVKKKWWKLCSIAQFFSPKKIYKRPGPKGKNKIKRNRNILYFSVKSIEIFGDLVRWFITTFQGDVIPIALESLGSHFNFASQELVGIFLSL